MATVSTVAINLIARTSTFERNMKRSRKTFVSMSATIRNTRRMLVGFSAALLGGGGLVFALKSVVKVASDSIETLNKFEGVFKGLSVSAKAWATDFAKSAGRARTDVLRWMATLQDTLVPLGFARDKAADMSKALVKLAADVASFSNQADEKVVEDFTSALVGQTKAVLKYGIVTNIAQLKQEALNQGFTKSFTQLTNLEKVQLRYNVIQRSTKDAQGDVVRTANDWANQMKRLQSNITTIKELLGARFIERFNDNLIGLNKSLQRVNIAQTDNAINLGTAIVQYAALAIAVKQAIVVMKGFQTLQKAIIAADATAATFKFAGAMGTLAISVAAAAAALTILIDRMNQAEATAITNASKAIEARGKFFARIIKAQSAATKQAEKREPLGMSLRSRATLSGARQLAKDAEDAAKAQERLNNLQKQADSIVSSLLTPMERYENEISQLNELLQAGVLSWEFYARGVLSARNALEQAADAQKQFDALSDQRSIGEFREITSSQVDIAGLSAGSALSERSSQVAVLEENKRQTALLERIADKPTLSQEG